MTRKQQLISGLRNIEVGTINKEKNFGFGTALIKIFGSLYRLFESKHDVSKEDIVNAAERERLELEGYNRREIFSNVEQNGQVKPQRISSTSNQVIDKRRTTGDGNCLFHAVFGNNSFGEYKADKAQAMRQEWHKFLSKFESLDDSEMPEALKERLSLIFYDVFPEIEEESEFNTSALYEAYLNKISQQGYFIRAEELPILASLANIEINLFVGSTDPMVLKPNPKMVKGYKKNQELWGNKERETIYLGGSHYSRAEVVMQDKSIPLLDPKLAKQVQDDRKLAEKLQQEESDYELAMKLQGQEYDDHKAQASQEKSDRSLAEAEKLQAREISSFMENAFQERLARQQEEKAKLQQEEKDYELAMKLQAQEYNDHKAQASQEKSDRSLAEKLQAQEISSFMQNAFQGHLNRKQPQEQTQEQEDRKLAEKLQQEQNDYQLAMMLQKQEYNSLRRDTVKNTFKEDAQGYADKLLTEMLQRGGREVNRLVKGLVKDFPKHGPSSSMQQTNTTQHQQTPNQSTLIRAY